MLLSEFIAEIESDLSTYAETGSLDRILIKNIVLNELKPFGNNIVTLHTEIIEVDNSQGTLPDNFRRLKAAIKIDPLGCDEEDYDNAILYKTTVKNPAYFSFVTNEYVRGCDTEIISEYLHRGNKKVGFYYGNPMFLNVKKSNKSSLAADCVNKRLGINCPFDISVVNRTLHTNFSKGTVLVQYYGFETDEDGEIIIPEDPLNHIERFLSWEVKYRIAVSLAGNNQNAQGMGQMIQLYKQESESARGRAMTSAKFGALGQNWAKKLKLKNQRDMRVFEIPML